MSWGITRSFHLGPPLRKGMRQYFNKHLKVTDPKLQDPDYFDKLADALPLDNYYLDNLKNMWVQKVGSERELMMKASDKLIGRQEGDYALPQIDPLRPRLDFEKVDVLKEASESVKKIFSVEFGLRSDLSAVWKREIVSKVRLDELDQTSLSAKIAWATASIRHWTALVDEMLSRNPKKPVWLTTRIFLMLGYRRKLLRQLREQDFDSFSKVLDDLKISYQIEKPPEHVKTRKAWSEHKLKQRVEAEKEQRLEELRAQFEETKQTRVPQLEKELDLLNKERKSVQARLNELERVEGRNVDSLDKYQLQTVQELSEITMHHQLLYFQKPVNS